MTPAKIAKTSTEEHIPVDLTQIQTLAESFKGISTSTRRCGTLHWLFVVRDTPEMCCQIPFDNPRLVITSEGLFFLDAFHQKLKSGSWSITCMDAIISILEQLQAQSGYVVCPGVNFVLFQDKIRVMKSLRSWGIPFNRHDSAKCLMWHKPKQLRSSQYSINLAIKREMCSECRSLVNELRRQHKKANDIPDCVRDKRRSASSDMK